LCWRDDCAKPRESGRARQHTLAVIGVQAHLLPFVGRQRPRLLPDPRVDRHPTEVVEKPGPPDRAHIHRIDPAGFGCRAGEHPHTGGVTGEVRRDQVSEAPHRGKRAIDSLTSAHAGVTKKPGA
jgi:hypothetical protein